MTPDREATMREVERLRTYARDGIRRATAAMSVLHRNFHLARAARLSLKADRLMRTLQPDGAPMPTAEDLRALKARVDAAKGPDREIDRAVLIGLGVLHIDPEADGHRPAGRLYAVDSDGSRRYGGLGDDILIKPVTASLDAALALVERVLPGFEDCELTLNTCRRAAATDDHFAGWQFRIALDRWQDDPDETGPEAVGDALTPTLAVLSALLAALIAREEEASRVD